MTRTDITRSYHPRPFLPLITTWRSCSWSLKRDGLLDISTWVVTEAICNRRSFTAPFLAVDPQSLPLMTLAASRSTKLLLSTPRLPKRSTSDVTTFWRKMREPWPRPVTGASHGRELPSAFGRSGPPSRHSRVGLLGHGQTIFRHVGAAAPTCSCCSAMGIDTGHARVCPGAGAQLDQHQPLLHAIFRTLRWLELPHQVQSRKPFTESRSLG